jgi:hypothetical protein
MERFLAFAGKKDFPLGGWEDFVADYSDIEEAKVEIEKYMREFAVGPSWYHIIDQEEGQIVLKWHSDDDIPPLDDSQLS